MSSGASKGLILREYLWKYRKWVLFGLLSLLVTDLFEVLPPILLKESVDVITEGRPERELLGLALGYFGMSILQGLGRYGWRMFLIRASMFAGRDLRDRYTSKLFSLGPSFFDRRRIGDLMSLGTNDVEAVRIAIGPGLITFADALFYLMTVPIAMFWLSPKLTLLAFLPLPIIPWIAARTERTIQDRYEQVQESFSKISALAQENLNGIRVVKAFGCEDRKQAELRDAGEEFVRLNLSLARAQSAFGPSLDFIMSLGMVLLLWFGGRGVVESSVTLGTFVAFQRYIQKMVWPMTAIGLSYGYYQRAIVSSRRLVEIFDTEPDVKEASHPRLPAPRKVRGEVEFRDLSFRFPSAREEALKKISLHIQPGERIAFVGAIGAGKSALLSLLPRLYPVGDGQLFVDGLDVNDWDLAALRSQLGFVAQEVFLFSETISENVAFGLSQGNPSEVEQASRLASVHEDVLGLPSEYRTLLGERGVNLSGGQKQRLTIARAIAKQPSILVLDDALSSVDTRTEERILQGLRDRPHRNTELIAAHRISTVKDADRIVVLERGSMIQLGTHAQLIRQKGGAYQKFYDQQRLKEDFEKYVEKYVPPVQS